MLVRSACPLEPNHRLAMQQDSESELWHSKFCLDGLMAESKCTKLQSIGYSKSIMQTDQPAGQSSSSLRNEVEKVMPDALPLTPNAHLQRLICP